MRKGMLVLGAVLVARQLWAERQIAVRCERLQEDLRQAMAERDRAMTGWARETTENLESWVEDVHKLLNDWGRGRSQAL